MLNDSKSCLFKAEPLSRSIPLHYLTLTIFNYPNPASMLDSAPVNADDIGETATLRGF